MSSNNLNPEINRGYRITNWILFNNDRGFALGENKNAPDKYVTWQFTQEPDGRRSYYWGHYFSIAGDSKSQAMSDYRTRVDEYKQDNGVEAIDSYSEKSRLFVDMDGTVAKWETKRFEDLFEQGYYLNRPTYQNVVDGLKLYMEQHPETDVYSLSAYLEGSKYALSEKHQWLDGDLPQIDRQHRIFVPYGADKAEFVPGGIRETDYLMDDYTKNLLSWEEYGGTGLKLLNGINGTVGTWAERDGKTVDGTQHQTAEEIADTLSAYINNDVNSSMSHNISEQQADILAMQGLTSMDMGM